MVRTAAFLARVKPAQLWAKKAEVGIFGAFFLCFVSFWASKKK
jgi:hypothetical protein